MSLPRSTIEMLVEYLLGVRSPLAVRSWADELIELGIDRPAVIEAALIEDHEDRKVEHVLSQALLSLGILSGPDAMGAAARDLLIERLRDPAVDPSDTIGLGWKLGCKLGYAGGDGLRETVLSDFVDLSDHLSSLEQWGERVPDLGGRDLREWALAFLAGDIEGPIERTRLRS